MHVVKPRADTLYGVPMRRSEKMVVPISMATGFLPGIPPLRDSSRKTDIRNSASLPRDISVLSQPTFKVCSRDYQYFQDLTLQ